MSIAVLGIKTNDKNELLNIDSSTLHQIDNITRLFKDEKDLMNSSYYQDRMGDLVSSDDFNSKIVLTYVKNNQEKLDLDIIYNDK